MPAPFGAQRNLQKTGKLRLDSFAPEALPKERFTKKAEPFGKEREKGRKEIFAAPPQLQLEAYQYIMYFS